MKSIKRPELLSNTMHPMVFHLGTTWHRITVPLKL